MDFTELVTGKELALYWEEVGKNISPSYVAAGLFPSSKQVGLRLSWLKGKGGLPVVLQPSAFDTKASLRDRIGFAKVETELPFFREAMRVGEKDRQDIETFLASGMNFAAPLIAKIYDDEMELIKGADVQAERMRMQVIQTGKISVSGGDEQGRPVAYDYNFDPNGEWIDENWIQLVGDDAWIEANKAAVNPMEQIDLVVEAAKSKNVTLTRAMLNTTTVNAMLRMESIAKAMNPVGYANTYTNKKELLAYVSQRTGIEFIVNDEMFKDENGKATKFMDEGKLVFMPAGTLGNTVYGTTPEEFELLGGRTANADTHIVNTGVAVTTIKEAHPVNVQTIVSEIVMPSFEGMDSVYILQTV